MDPATTSSNSWHDDTPATHLSTWQESKQETEDLFEYPHVIGTLRMTFALNRRPLECFLTTVQMYSRILSCKETNWLETLERWVRELRITHLYVVGVQAYQFIREKNLLKGVVLTLDENDVLRYKAKCCNNKTCIMTYGICSIKRNLRRFRFELPKH
jgi:hypothetical protein